jgi:hypothetical protein
MTDDQDPHDAVTAFLRVLAPDHPDVLERVWADKPYELRISHLRAILAQNTRMLSLLLGHPKNPDPAPWTDPDTGATYDLMRPLTDSHGGRWEHAGWLHRLGPDAPPEPVLVLLSEDPPVEDTWARVSEQWGPLTQATTDRVGGVDA